MLYLINLFLIASIKGPLFNARALNQACLRQNLQMFASGRLAHSKFVCDEKSAYPISDQVSVNLRCEVFHWIAQPSQDLQPTLVGQSFANIQ